MSDLLEQLGLAGSNAGPGTGYTTSPPPAPTSRPPSPRSESLARLAIDPRGGQDAGSQAGGGYPFPTADQVANTPPAPMPAFGKIAQPDATYCDPGPAPFVCGVCIFYLSGVGEAGGSVSGQGTCQLVDGEIGEGASCRFFRARPPVAGMVVPASGTPGPPPPPDQPQASQGEAGGPEGNQAYQTEISASPDGLDKLGVDNSDGGASGWGDHGLIAEGE